MNDQSNNDTAAINYKVTQTNGQEVKLVKRILLKNFFEQKYNQKY